MIKLVRDHEGYDCDSVTRWEFTALALTQIKWSRAQVLLIQDVEPGGPSVPSADG